MGAMDDTLHYVRLRPGEPPPELSFDRPLKAVVVIECDVTDDWRNEISDWLVKSGCLYMMARGRDCSKWDDSVDWAVLERFGFGDIPDNQFVMTAWHEHETLTEVFQFSHWHALAYGTFDAIETTLILDISPIDRESEMRAAYLAAPLQLDD